MLLNRLSENNKKLFLNLELFLVNADGEYSEPEDRMIKAHCIEMGLEPVKYDESLILEEIIKNINAQMTVKEKKIVLIELLTVAIVDGVYDDREKEFVGNLRKVLQIPEEVGEQAFDMVKKLVDASTSIENFVEW